MVPSASAASLAVRTASAAVKQPAVFGSTRMPRSASTSSTDPAAAGSTRRMATVVSSVPEAIQRPAQHVQAGRAAGAHDQPASEGLAGEHERVVHVSLPAPR